MKDLLLLIYRGIYLLLLITAFIIQTSWIKMRLRSSPLKNRTLAETAHRYALKITSHFNVTFHIQGEGSLEDSHPCLILSNHLSYIDIIMISAVRPTLFLSHTGIQQEPLIGAIAESGGTLFVDRSSKAKLSSEMERLAGLLKEGNTMTLFPEGTTGNGEGIMPFHSAFIDAAVRSEVPVQPICLQYTQLNGSSLTAANKNIVFIYDHVPFLPHIWRLYKNIRTLTVSVYVFDKISTLDKNRKEVSERARQEMIRIFKPVK